MDKKITKQQEESLLLYSIYTIMYLNDTACNAVKEVKPYLKDKDKESQKIFSALEKRVHKYFTEINKVVGDKMDYYADYCSEMDDICYNPMLDFKNALYDVYKENKLNDNEYYTQVETMRSLIDLSVEAASHVISQAAKNLPKADWLKYYVLKDMQRIANNFASWTYRKVPKDLDINFNEDSDVMKSFVKLSGAMIEWDSFDKAYKKAIEYEKERNNNK